ncbi:PilC/PilY family type IV pilus protein [Gilvimarinus sp. SDUM040013]|uniref:PilC/PilY family type IV pilus protein n=1 Tax=Gilvimarinus gilvus TaxID=3058038 RepID=A0ABU4S0K8_9GAMM|nr:PilC/PilY family type IV pilus protein [Gilvimarinus sp. SDUM040013]MDO3384880.1 PilC/PilY family type IV pilus protein [Gilvimarinus sp. SDUM040013]MDX6850695.1 PilC/PilY family type IV pilus protein [Gilvimarinus sp. SDUM040013]
MRLFANVKTCFERPRWLVALATGVLTLGTVHSVSSAEIDLAQMPLFLAEPVRPIVMLNMSNDHQLYFKAYDDYSDLDGDGLVDTTYKNSYDYYGYFDSEKCYKHDGAMFKVSSSASNHKCSGEWSGNFLNWATMTRIDSVRKILYGGKRAKNGDSASQTVLERAFLPQDAHSFAKYYNGTDMADYTPYSWGGAGINDGITMCNTTLPSVRSQQSQNVTDPPVVHVKKGNYSLWASNERWQCVVGKAPHNSSTVSNGNDSTKSGINAHSSNPDTVDATLIVRVEVCANGISATNNEKCEVYGADGNGLKPAGLLQKYGQDDSIWFGLMTGSYLKSKSGGVLRKNVSSMADEIDEDGTFKTPTDSIIGTLDKLRIARYASSDGRYNSSDNCAWGKGSFNNGQCTNWGNPQSEIYLESLRYLARDVTTPAFAVNDSTIISGLNTATWEAPIGEDNYCAPTAILQFNASTSSYDGDELGKFSDVQNGAGTLDSITNTVGAAELSASSYFVGETAGDDNQLCTAKSVGSLSDVRGTCPDAPRLEGSYAIAGLAYHARINGVSANQETIQTFGVALAPAVPSVSIPATADSVVTILPACRNDEMDGNCAIVDFKVVKQDHSSGTKTGTLYVNWEDSEQGGDFDQDMWGIIEYEVNSTTVKITTDVIAQSTPNVMGFGYVIAGTNMDGFHVHSGINNFDYTNDIDGALDCVDCQTGNGATTQEFSVASSGASPLPQPLYFASKWGGFDPDELGDDGNPRTTPPAGAEAPTYFYATDPRELEASLEDALETFAEGAGAASAVATNSTRLGTDSVAYQATFNTSSWSGDLIAAPLNDVGLGATNWSAANMLAAAGSREIWTHNGSTAVEFKWGGTPGLSDEQKDILNAHDDRGEDRVSWTRGNEVTGFNERESHQRLGDIVNSNPQLASTDNYGYGRTAAVGASSYNAFASGKTAKTVFVGSNDGMLHAFDATTGAERFAYIPAGVYEQLVTRTHPNYGSSFMPHQFSVDGQVFIGDAYFDGQWRTILVGALGAGGKGIFGLDITSDIGTDSISFSADNVLFDYTVSNDSSSKMGNVMGAPVIAPMPDGSWAILMGNGYNSTGEEARLVIIPLDGDFVPEYIATGKTGSNALSEPSLSVGAGFLPNFAYAGDRQGNMYKFDLKNKNLEYLLFEATDSSNGENAQPITSAPVLGVNPFRKFSDGSDGVMVYFGTGSYVTRGDLSNTSEQSFYGIADTGETVTRDQLFQKRILQADGATTRNVDEGAVDETEDEFPWDESAGWYMDFDTVTGERVVDKPILLYDRVIFPTVVPTDSPCDYGGKSWIMALIGVGQLYTSYSPFSEGESDTDPVEGVESDTLTKLSPPNDAGPKEPGVPVPCDGGTFIIQQNSDGSVEFICTGEPDVIRGRQSWRQIQ